MVNSTPFRKRLSGALRRLSTRPLMPGRCLFCSMPSADDIDICAPCRADLPWLEPGCRRCALPLPDPEESELCGRCLIDPPAFQRTEACWLYRPPLARAIATFKYHRNLGYGRSLGILMADRIASAYSHGAAADFITSVPLHLRRRLRRGFNQSEMIAQLLAGQLQLPYRPLLKRTRATPAQQTLDAEDRYHNLKNAFRSKPLRGETVAVVDDVMTTGATADEVSRCLLAAGAGEVHIWCLARTPL